ncbi:MAG: glucose dehydrogenase [Phycisphaerae bacterium]|nr:MAG: glucose dehydrogenase [Phycisphaerae bacterium]
MHNDSTHRGNTSTRDRVGTWALHAALAGCFIAINALTGCVETPRPGSGDDPLPGDEINLAVVADGLTSPLGLVDDGTGRKFIYDQVGTIHILNSNGTLNETPFLDISDRMIDIFGGGIVFDERGLLGFALHPDFADNGRFFVMYSADKGETDPPAFDSQSRLSEFRVSDDDPNVADPDSELILLEILQPQSNHNGGELAFGPEGNLYIAVGDGGSSNDVGLGHTPDLGNGQDRSNLMGSILRIDVNGAPNPGLAYAIPATNPFANDEQFRGEIFAYGLRNPFRFSFDQGGDNALYAGDVGQDLMEEVNVITNGGNYGWNIREGNNCFSPTSPGVPLAVCADVGADGTPLVEPILTYQHIGTNGARIGISVIGGYVYRGNDIPTLNGQYIFGDFTTDFGDPNGSIFAASQDENGAWTRRELAVTGNNNGRLNQYLFAFGQDANGEVYVMASDNAGPVGNRGVVYKIEPAE